LGNIEKNIDNIIREYRLKLKVYEKLFRELSRLPSEKKRIERLEAIRDEHKIEYFRVVDYRNSAVKDWTHKIARFIINYCKKHRIGVIVCGYNKGGKNNAPLKRSNKKFQLLPHLRIVEYLKYKGVLEGIDVIRTEESYTSMASHLNLADVDLLKKLGDEIKELKYKIERTDDLKLITQYDDKIQKLRKQMNKEKKGIRGVYINPKSIRYPNAEPYISRGLFKSYIYGIIHSDVNADLGIARKADDLICQKYGLSVKPFESYIKKITRDGSYRKILNPIKIKNIEVALSSS
jgi:IS605 OrfB family transposase